MAPDPAAGPDALTPLIDARGPSAGFLWAGTRKHTYPVLKTGLTDRIATLACRAAGFPRGRLAGLVSSMPPDAWTRMLTNARCRPGAAASGGCSAALTDAGLYRDVASVQCFNTTPTVLGSYDMAPWRLGSSWPDRAARWIYWGPRAGANLSAAPADLYPSFTKLVRVGVTTAANLAIAAADQADVFLNGVYQGSVLGGWGSRPAQPVPLVLWRGRNNVTILVTNYGSGPAGLLASLAEVRNGSVLARTDSSWSVDVATVLPGAVSLGPAPLAPWTRVSNASLGMRGAEWIWASRDAAHAANPAVAPTFFGRFAMPAAGPVDVCFAIDDVLDLFLNGVYVSTYTSYAYGPNGDAAVNCTRLQLPAGPNLIAARCANGQLRAGVWSPAGLILSVRDGPVAGGPAAPNATYRLRSSANWTLQTASPAALRCPAMAGYVASPHMDYFGAGAATFFGPSHVAANCSASPGCRGFSLKGWAYSAALIEPGNLREVPGSCFYSKLYAAALLGSPSMAPWNLTRFPDADARWIWALPGGRSSATYTPSFTKFHITPFAVVANLTVAAADQADVFLNGIYQGSVIRGWGGRAALPVPMLLPKGRNNITIRVTTYSPGPAGLLASLADVDSGRSLIRTDASWSANTLSSMPSAARLGPAGMAPWLDPRPTASNGFASASWIWSGLGAERGAVPPSVAPTFFRTLSLPAPLPGARIYAAADNITDVFVNGVWAGAAGLDVPDWDARSRYLSVDLAAGPNLIAARCANGGVQQGWANPAGLMLALVDPRSNAALLWTNETWGVEAGTDTGECPRLNGYAALPESDHTGDDLGFAGVAAAMRRCSEDERCAGFDSRGFLKSSVVPAQSTAGTCLFMKGSPWGWRRRSTNTTG